MKVRKTILRPIPLRSFALFIEANIFAAQESRYVSRSRFYALYAK
jgi:hypothetical protein